jgi:hypothetical protein
MIIILDYILCLNNRTKSKSGLKIIGAYPSNPTMWNVTVDQIHTKGTSATVTATLREDLTLEQLTKMGSDDRSVE